MKRIDNYEPRSGRTLKEDDSIVNTANMLDGLHEAFVNKGNAGVHVTKNPVYNFPKKIHAGEITRATNVSQYNMAKSPVIDARDVEKFILYASSDQNFSVLVYNVLDDTTDPVTTDEATYLVNNSVGPAAFRPIRPVEYQEITGEKVMFAIQNSGDNPATLSLEAAFTMKQKTTATNNIKAKNIRIVDSAVHLGQIPKARDRNNVLWNSSKWPTMGLQRKENFQSTWFKVLDPPHDTNKEPTALMMPRSGRAIWCTLDGYVFVSDPAKTTWSLAFSMPTGDISINYGYWWDADSDIVLISSYGEQSTSDSPRFVYGSKDGGATFIKIYEGPQMVGYHIHTVAYLKRNGRIVIAEGDAPRRQILWSDDWGANWNKAWDTDGVGLQPTQIVECEHGILFGSDQPKDGLALWRSDPDLLYKPINGNEIDREYFLIDGSATLKQLFHKGWDDGQLFLFCTSPAAAGGYGRLFASLDCRTFTEIWRDESNNNYSVSYVIGPSKNDPNRVFYAVLTKGTETHLLTGNLEIE